MSESGLDDGSVIGSLDTAERFLYHVADVPPLERKLQARAAPRAAPRTAPRAALRCLTHGNEPIAPMITPDRGLPT